MNPASPLRSAYQTEGNAGLTMQSDARGICGA